MHHLDANIVVAFLRGNPTVAERVEKLRPEVAISTLVLGELLYGAAGASNPAMALGEVRRFAKEVHVVGFDELCAEAYNRMRLSLRRKGRPSGEIDTLIAAVAMAHYAVLVTHNVKHFRGFEGLIVEDWLDANSGRVGSTA